MNAIARADESQRIGIMFSERSLRRKRVNLV